MGHKLGHKVSLRSVSGLSQVCLRSVSGLFQVCLRSVLGLSQVCLRSVSGLFRVSYLLGSMIDPEILCLVYCEGFPNSRVSVLMLIEHHS